MLPPNTAFSETGGADVPYDVIRACVHLEREHPPKALWLACLAPSEIPAEMTIMEDLSGTPDC